MNAYRNVSFSMLFENDNFTLVEVGMGVGLGLGSWNLSSNSLIHVQHLKPNPSSSVGFGSRFGKAIRVRKSLFVDRNRTPTNVSSVETTERNNIKIAIGFGLGSWKKMGVRLGQIEIG
jgi:hypothetical protein